MSALDWLKKQQAESLRRQALFDARPRVAASQAWGGYVDKPGGQRLMVRQPQPEVKNKLVEKRGNATLTKEWVSPYPQGESTLNVSALPDHERTKMIPLPPNVYKRGFQPSPAREVSSGWLDRMIRSGNAPVAQDTRPSPQTIRGVASGYDRQPRSTMPEAVRASGGPSMEVLPGESIEEARLRIFGRGSPESPARETWGGDLNLTLPQHPRTRRWIQDPSTILNMGNLIKSMGRTFQGVDDRLERNRIRRLMEHRTANPYYTTGNPYGMNAVNRSPYSGGRY